MRERIKQACADGAISALGALGLVIVFGGCGLLDDLLALGWMTASFGASITLLVACPDSPLGTPRSSLIGNIGSAAVGVVCQTLLGGFPVVAAIAAITGAIVVMRLFDALHPPGGASAMLAVIGGESVHALGWLYPLCPIGIGTVWLLLVAALRRR